MLNQKKVEIFSIKFRKSPAKQFLEIAIRNMGISVAYSALCVAVAKILLWRYGTCPGLPLL